MASFDLFPKRINGPKQHDILLNVYYDVIFNLETNRYGEASQPIFHPVNMFS